MMHGFQQIVTQAECRDNFVVHGLPPLGDEIAVSPLIWRKKLMDSIGGNLGYISIVSQRVDWRSHPDAVMVGRAEGGHYAGSALCISSRGCWRECPGRVYSAGLQSTGPGSA